MPELRKDPIVGRWVIISTERGKRPTSFKLSERPAVVGGFCPLCVGNEDKTPPEVYAVRPDGSKPNTPGWTLRVVSNKFPAFIGSRLQGRTDPSLNIVAKDQPAEQPLIMLPSQF